MSDLVSLIMEYEDGQLNDEETINLFQRLYDDGMIRSLQGSYQRMFRSLRIAGLIKLR